MFFQAILSCNTSKYIFLTVTLSIPPPAVVAPVLGSVSAVSNQSGQPAPASQEITRKQQEDSKVNKHKGLRKSSVLIYVREGGVEAEDD